MKTQGAHAHEDRLLDFAYGELPPSEARVMEQHVQGCSRCSDALEGIRGVRTTMSRLPLESAPGDGLDSLLAYAQQSARRSAAGPEPAPTWWRRLLAPALGVAALGVFGVVVVQVNRQVDLGPSTLVKEAAQEKRTRQEREVAGLKDVSAAPAPAAAQVAPEPAQVAAAPQQAHAEYDEEIRAKQRAEPAPAKPSPKPARRSERTDWSNAGAGSAGGFPDKKGALSDEDAYGLDGFGGKASKSKRGAAITQTLPSLATAQRAEPARDEAPAEAESQEGPMAEASAPMPGESQAVEYAPPSSMQKPGGSTSRPASPTSGASFDDDVRQAPGRNQLASAAPPPPPPPAQYQPSAPAAAAPARAEALESRKAEEASREKSAATRRALSPAELMKQADVAYRSGDRNQESVMLRAALGAGAQGAQRLEALSRLCDAEVALGRRRSAIDVCKRVMLEAPGTREAGVAQRLLERELQSPADEAHGESKAADSE